MGSPVIFRGFAILLVITLLVGGCQPEHKHAASVRGATDVPDATWVERLSFWLRIGYREEEDVAYFASIRPDLLDQPNLYTTYGAVGLLTELERNVPQAHAIVDWITSLKGSQGAYDDPRNELPLLVETYWAVTILARLGITPPDPEETASFIQSLQSESGLFAPDADLGGPAAAQTIVATQFAVETLLTLSVTEHDILLRSAEALEAYLQSHVTGVSPDLKDGETRTFVVAAHTLAQIDPTALSEDVSALLRKTLDALPPRSGHPLMVGLVRDLWDTLQRTGIVAQDTAPDALSRYVAQDVLPRLTERQPHELAPGSFDPLVTYEAVALVRRTPLSLPDLTPLLQSVMKYRIDNGWITFVIPTPDPQATYYALDIARQIGFEAYNAEKVAHYLESFLHVGEERVDYADVYFAWQGLVLLERAPEAESLRTLKKRALSDAEMDRGALVAVTRLARACGWALPDAVREQISRVIRQTQSSGLHRIEQLYELALLHAVHGEEATSRAKLTSKVLALRSKEGGFKATAEAPKPDLHATFLALQALALLGREEAVDAKAMIDFVWSCRDTYGFNYVSTGAATAERYDLQPDLFVTWEGLTLLAMLSESAPVSVSYEPPDP